MRSKCRVPRSSCASLCAGRALTSSEAAIVGRVHERGDTLPAAGARVVAEWTRDRAARRARRGGRALEQADRGKDQRGRRVPALRCSREHQRHRHRVDGVGVERRASGLLGSRIVRVELVLDRDVATNGHVRRSRAGRFDDDADRRARRSTFRNCRRPAVRRRMGSFSSPKFRLVSSTSSSAASATALSTRSSRSPRMRRSTVTCI